MINLKVTAPRNYFVAEKGNNKNNILKLLIKLEKFGVLLTPEAVKVLSTTDNFKIIKKSLKSYFKPISGHYFKSSFASLENIEDEAMTEKEYMLQIRHYFITYGLGIEMVDLSEKKIKKIDTENYKILDVKSVSEFIEDVRNTITLPIVFGEQQLDIIKEAYNQGLLETAFDNVKELKVKENIFKILEISDKEIFKKINILKTTTDVLRYAYFVSEEDYINLPPYTHFNLKTSDKKIIMKSLNNIQEAYNDMRPKKKLWLSVAINLHPGSKLFSKYPKAQECFHLLRNKNNVRTFNQLTQIYMKEKRIKDLISHLSSKPGILLRNIDFIVRNSDDKEISLLVSVINETKFNTKLMLQIMKWLKYRKENDSIERFFNVKGVVTKINDKPIFKLNSGKADKIIKAFRDNIIETLKDKNILGENISSICIDNKLKKYILPKELRNNSRAENIIFTPGTRIPVDKNIKYLRSFLAWASKDGKEKNIDLDLGAVFVYKDGSTEEIAYYNQYSDYATHSGDFTFCREFNEKEGIITAEFVDMDINKLIKKGVKYVIVSDMIYAGEADNFNDTQAWSGLQVLSGFRKESGETINLHDSLFKFKLTGDFQAHISFAFDIENKEIVVMDKYTNEKRFINAHSFKQKMDLYTRFYLEASKYNFSVYEFLEIYCEAKGIKISEKSDKVYDYKTVSDNLEKIISIL